MNDNLVFCIECGEMTVLQKVDMGGVHIVGHEKVVPVYDEVGDVEGTDLDFCEYPKGFAYSAPLEQPADWIESVTEDGKFLPDTYSFYDIELELKQGLIA